MADKGKMVHATAIVAQFQCLGASCEDSCCGGWAIEVDPLTRQRYERKPDLRDAIYAHEDGCVMCHKTGTDTCVKNDNGWCGIQRDYGADFLSETCYFFPRTFRKLGGVDTVSTSLSCPESARMALFGEGMFTRQPLHSPRTMSKLEERLEAPHGFTEADAIHTRIMASLDDTSLTVEQHLARLIALSYALDKQPRGQWANVTEAMLTQPPPAPSLDLTRRPLDAFDIAHAMLMLAVADGTQYRPRLYRTIRDMEVALELTFHWMDMSVEASAGSEAAWTRVQQHWQAIAPQFDPMLRNWLRAQLARDVFPFAGLGRNVAEHIFTVAMGFVTTRLALMCACEVERGIISPQEQIRVVQSIARILEHITEAKLIFTAFHDRNWRQEDVLRGLIA